LADIAVYSHFAALERNGWKLGEDKEFTNLASWYKRVSEREAVKKTVPPHWKDSTGVQLF